ncbi:uroporphyrin-III C-methyltransferase [Defluviimonas sp. 20V17]|uniref:uroporphyrinogen-III C-methyltransferase n=1 Tax=Allgaiera indica TaxID=765699 RepID=A0AAN4UUS8_9RHOB|nr:uroporphyrinogen-III C-methyltransferase [Allgaiera indica]KDB04948.1 uroporphyrin-III C-methyltransferase [Defluviimonas sp. 20V17]GHE05722.1 uroporphyrinogen-III C-methyltransferase [Allgaiera indica]SDX76696.1 uroporphyrinogen-III C-methyltransferase [Allgaiera indica]
MPSFLLDPGTVAFVGAGPGDPGLLTLHALRALQMADVVIHDRLASDDILAHTRPAATRISVGKEGFGPSVPQTRANALLVAHARAGARVVRLKGGDPAIFARLDEEIAALDAAGIAWQIVPGITAASAAAARLGQGLTQRGRNAGVRLVTGHDAKGFADQDWRALAAPGAIAAIYMGKRAARFIQGRLMMHGAAPTTPVTLVENASRADERVLPATLATLPEAAAGLDGPAILMLGLAPRAARATAKEALA